MKLLYYLLLTILINLNLSAQQSGIFSNLKSSFERNDYLRVITLSQQLLELNNALSEDTLLIIYEMTAVSNFSLGEREKSKKNFIEILKIDSGYTPNPSKISPKIIQFFNPIKNDFEQILDGLKANGSNSEIDVQKPVFPDKVFDGSLFANSITRSIVFPGWGHLYSGQNTKGIVLTISNALLLGSSIYFAIRTSKLEDEYIFQSDKKLITEKYDKYNTSYKIRNIIFATYALLWIYSQLDLLFLSDDVFFTPFSPIENANNTSITPSEFNFSFRITL